MNQKKIVPLEKINEALEPYRASGKKIVLSHGVFDLLHVGHLRHFESARRAGDLLVVSITADKFITKGKPGPAFPEALRAELLAALECVDLVTTIPSPSAIESINTIRPSFYAKGKEYRDRAEKKGAKLAAEEAAVRTCGGKMLYTEDLAFSSSSLKNLCNLEDETNEILTELRTNISVDELTILQSSWQNSSVQIIGQTSFSQLYGCDRFVMSNQRPTSISAPTFLQKSTINGSPLIANHLAGFFKEVTLLTNTSGEMIVEEGSSSKEVNEVLSQQLRSAVKVCHTGSIQKPEVSKQFYRLQDGHEFLVEKVSVNMEQEAEKSHRDENIIAGIYILVEIPLRVGLPFLNALHEQTDHNHTTIFVTANKEVAVKYIEEGSPDVLVIDGRKTGEKIDPTKSRTTTIVQLLSEQIFIYTPHQSREKILPVRKGISIQKNLLEGIVTATALAVKIGEGIKERHLELLLLTTILELQRQSSSESLLEKEGMTKAVSSVLALKIAS